MFDLPFIYGGIVSDSIFSLYNLYHKWFYPELVYLPFDDSGSTYLLLEYPIDT